MVREEKAAVLRGPDGDAGFGGGGEVGAIGGEGERSQRACEGRVSESGGFCPVVTGDGYDFCWVVVSGDVWIVKEEGCTVSSGCDYEVLSGDMPYSGTVMIELWRTEKTRNLCEVIYTSVAEGETYSESATMGMMPSMTFTCVGSSSDTSHTIIFPSAPQVVCVSQLQSC